MTDKLRKICLYIIYIGVGVILFSPILVDNRFFFPFITTKVFLFRGVVEIILLAFLVLNAVSHDWRPKWNWPVVFLAGFIGVAAVSSLVGGNWNISFWGDIERGEGLLLWLHLLAFFVILTSVFKTRNAWAALFDFSLGSSLLLGLFGLGQALKVESLLATSGERVDATLGNPAFFATYLIFHIAIALLLFSFRKSKPARAYYSTVILFYTVLVFVTQTRGAVLGLGAGVFLGAVLLVWSNRENARARKWSLIFAVLVILTAAAAWNFRNIAVVQNSFLRRIASISLQNRTAQTRLATWGAALKGIKEKPILGWGMENFDVVFNKNFPPIIYADEGSQVWFDRAHNVILDRVVSTGIMGLGLFLAFLLYPAYYLLRYRLRENATRNMAVIGVGLTAAYLIQDMFIFESIVIYMMLFFIWAFFATMYLPQRDFDRLTMGTRKVWPIAIVYAVLFPIVLWQVNIRPLRINAEAAAALKLDPEKEGFFPIVERYKKILAEPTYGTQEYRLQFIEWADSQLAPVGQIVPEVQPILEYFDTEAQKHIDEAPNNTKNLILVMRHYNYTYASYPDKKEERLRKALSIYDRLAVSSPTRSAVHQEAGYSHLYLYRVYKDSQDEEKAVVELAAAEGLFEKALDLNPRVVENYVNIIMLYLNSGDDQKIKDVIALMDERGVDFRVQTYLSKLANLARGSGRLRWIGYFNEEVVKLNPGDAQAWINVALFYATSGDRAKAIEIAGKIKEFGVEYEDQANIFIESVKNGEYEKPQ